MQDLALFLRLNNNKYGEGLWTDCPKQSQMSVQRMKRRLNKSYYEPFQGFAYCILVIIIVDMQNKKRKIAGKLTLAGNSYPSKLQRFITSTVGFVFPHTRTHTRMHAHAHARSPLETSVMVWACSAGGGRLHKPSAAVHQKSQKHRTVSRGIQNNITIKKKTVTVLLFRRLRHVLSLGKRTKINHEEKIKIL